MAHPYSSQPDSAFWRTAVAATQWDALQDLYTPKFDISATCRMATAGSCFAQHISRHLKMNGYAVLDSEPAPPGLPPERAARYGYGLFSARFGNIYTVRHLLQLAREAVDQSHSPTIWVRDGRFFDALRPSVEPAGLDSPEEVLAHRLQHLARVQQMLVEMDVFIFTFGLTEAWEDIDTGSVYPIAPGVIAGDFDRSRYRFRNFGYNDVMSDFGEFLGIVTRLRDEAERPEARYILTVSPVPLAATASGSHVLTATMHSKSILRSAAGALADSHRNVDYFPSFELIASPWSRSCYFADNMREVAPEGVQLAMQYFFTAHGVRAAGPVKSFPEEERDDMEVFCDEIIVEALRK